MTCAAACASSSAAPSASRRPPRTRPTAAWPCSSIHQEGCPTRTHAEAPKLNSHLVVLDPERADAELRGKSVAIDTALDARDRTAVVVLPNRPAAATPI